MSVLASEADRGVSGFPIPEGVFAETVTSVRHYTDRLFSFRITRRRRCASAPASS